MFNLENAIKEWRRELAASGVTSGDILDELESHLREDVERQLQLGAQAAEAFDFALRRVGDPVALEAEFSKTGTRPVSLLRIFRVACFVSSPVAFLAGAVGLWEPGTFSAGKILALITVSAVAIYLGTLPFWYRSLPGPGKPWIGATLKLLSLICSGWTLFALLGALEVIHLHLSNTLSMVCWNGYAAFAATIFAYVCRGQTDDSGGDNWSVSSKCNVSALVRASLEAARAEARRLRHDYIGTEHLLAGILETESNLLREIFRMSLVDREMVSREIEQLIEPGPAGGGAAGAPYTPRAKKALNIAADLACAMNHDFMSPEHLFLGLLRENEGLAGVALRKLGFDFERARAQIVRGFSSGGDDGPQPVLA